MIIILGLTVSFMIQPSTSRGTQCVGFDIIDVGADLWFPSKTHERTEIWNNNTKRGCANYALNKATAHFTPKADVFAAIAKLHNVHPDEVSKQYVADVPNGRFNYQRGFPSKAHKHEKNEKDLFTEYFDYEKEFLKREGIMKDPSVQFTYPEATAFCDLCYEKYATLWHLDHICRSQLWLKIVTSKFTRDHKYETDPCPLRQNGEPCCCDKYAWRLTEGIIEADKLLFVDSFYNSKDPKYTICESERDSENLDFCVCVGVKAGVLRWSERRFVESRKDFWKYFDTKVIKRCAGFGGYCNSAPEQTDDIMNSGNFSTRSNIRHHMKTVMQQKYSVGKIFDAWIAAMMPKFHNQDREYLCKRCAERFIVTWVELYRKRRRGDDTEQFLKRYPMERMTDDKNQPLVEYVMNECEAVNID